MLIKKLAMKNMGKVKAFYFKNDNAIIIMAILDLKTQIKISIKMISIIKCVVRASRFGDIVAQDGTQFCFMSNAAAEDQVKTIILDFRQES